MSLTNQEYFDLHGNLTPERIQELLDTEHEFNTIQSRQESIEDGAKEIIGIASTYMAKTEEFEYLKDELVLLEYNMKGTKYYESRDENREVIHVVLSKLEALRMDMMNSFEVMKEEIR